MSHGGSGRCEKETEVMQEENRDNDGLADIRQSVRKLCDGFPGKYWRKLDRERGYPSEFVATLTRAGFLSVLIPEQYGGCLLYTSDAADERSSVDLGGRRIIKKKNEGRHTAIAHSAINLNSNYDRQAKYRHEKHMKCR